MLSDNRSQTYTEYIIIVGLGLVVMVAVAAFFAALTGAFDRQTAKIESFDSQ